MLVRSFFTAITLAASTCSIICGVGCDWGEPGRCIGAGGPFGACDTVQCGSGLLCWGTAFGSFCAPKTNELTDEMRVCGEAFGEQDMFCLRNDVCVVPCDSDDECNNGSVCSTDRGVCVQPYNK